jgi:D-3-phosphoglycerate dehydrogenase / 2-oxoglutarate reductase
MFNILTLNPIAAIGLNQFSPDLYQVSSEITAPDAILVRSHVMHDMTFPDSLKVVGRAGVGVNNIPISKLTQLGIPVLNTVGANANAVRELVIAGMLLASRNICQAWDYVRQLTCEENQLDVEIEKNKKQFAGFELLGKTLGVIGLGSIGVKVANSAINLGMNVIGYDPTITVNRAWELSAGVKQARNIENVFTEADFITIHVPLINTTKNMISTASFHLMKPDVVLLNFSRDGIIDNNALLQALNEKKVLAYVSDFPQDQLKNHPRVISLPHLGASTKEAEDNCAVMIVKQVRNFLENGNIENAVNFPTIEMPRNNAGTRIAIVNANVPNIVAQISSKLGAAGLNIVSLSNGSKDEIAYTLIDVNTDISPSLLNEIRAINGIIRIRKVDVAFEASR